jgi:hypothetical protein
MVLDSAALGGPRFANLEDMGDVRLDVLPGDVPRGGWHPVGRQEVVQLTDAVGVGGHGPGRKDLWLEGVIYGPRDLAQENAVARLWDWFRDGETLESFT